MRAVIIPCGLFHVERWGLAYIPSAGLWGRRVIFVECSLVVRAERSGCVCPAFLCRGVPSLGFYCLWLLCSPLWGAVLFSALVLSLCLSLLAHSMPSGGRVG